MQVPVTLDEIRPQLKLMFSPMDGHMEDKYTVVHINNQFKIVGIFAASAHISTFTLELQQNVPRQFIYEDLHNVIKLMKHSFQEFLATCPKYTTPFHQHTHNTVFYYLNQIHYRILETITQIKQSYPHVVDQLLTQPATQNPDAHCTHSFPCCPRTPTPLSILQAYQPNTSHQQQQQNQIINKPIGTLRRKKFKIQHLAPHTETS